MKVVPRPAPAGWGLDQAEAPPSLCVPQSLRNGQSICCASRDPCGRDRRGRTISHFVQARATRDPPTRLSQVAEIRCVLSRSVDLD
ncbi:hypothetical protein F1880_001388 [Penicillium rolfsii]|nr:hypothetical protein F1880_001388 [Penicillium rolfsii]